MSQVINSKIYTHCADLKAHLQDIRRDSNVMIFATSGGFDPLHIGHLKCFQHMKKMST